jgi:hypothetical protein
MAQSAPARPKINTNKHKRGTPLGPAYPAARRGGAPAYAVRHASPPAAGL